MFQKEAGGFRRWNTRAQITLFIIIVLVILFSFLMVVQLTNAVAKGKLLQEQEKVSYGGFRKEALRLYVENCLEKSLEKGLILLGEQGTIWSDQPGGTKSYVEGITGVTQPSVNARVFYGITSKTYLSNPEQYPCEEGLAGPEYCQYSYPNTSVRFGVLTLADVTEDLRLYLIDQTYSCVDQFVEQKISENAVMEREELDLKLELRNDGIYVQANYPLKFSLSGEEFFYLSRFDFFYPTKFKQFYRSAVEFPFQQDYNFVDYELTPFNLLRSEFEYGSERTGDRIIPEMPITPLCRDNPAIAETFFCSRTTFAPTYQNLDIQLNIESSADGQDTIFEYTVPSGIVKNQRYTFRIARQNRPPALDYVHQNECPAPDGNPAKGYDYLVIKGDDQLGKIDISLNAKDPDENGPRIYTFTESTPTGLISAPLPADGHLVINPVTADSNIYTITATATDSDAQDSQKVRVLVDPELSTSISFDLPYGPSNFNFKNGAYFVSVEDPVFLRLQFPEPRSNGEIGTARLSAGNTDWTPVTLPLGNFLTGDIYYNFPSLDERSSSSDLSYYSDPRDIENIRTSFETPFDVRNPRLDLTLDYEVNYCGSEDLKQTSTSTATVMVKECVPYRNAATPSYPYNGNVNAFLADHTCCLGELNNPDSWRLALDGRTCYTNPTPGCYGEIEGYSRPYEGYVLERQLGVCDGVRGNTCTSTKGEVLNGPLLCGGLGKPDCKISGADPKIQAKCYGQSSWGLVADPDGAGPGVGGWCYGFMGCTQFCSPLQGESIVQVDPAFLHSPKDNKLNTDYAKPNFIQDLTGKLECGCKSEYNGRKCDAGFDGTFEGTCQLDGSAYKCKP